MRFLIAYAGMWLISRKSLFAGSLKDELLMLALFYKDERMNRSQIVGSVVAFIGMALVIFNGSPAIIRG